MADVCVLSVGGSRAVSLKPDHIYRIGKQSGSEIYIADESMELAHGFVCLLRTGIVRIAAVAGQIFVNGEEKQIADIRKKDARGGKVKLRFGKVEASLQFFEEAHDSSGFVPPKGTKGSPIKLEKNQDILLDATDLEMTALNWSATNSKCTVLNSTKADEDQRLDACITPELSAPLADANRDISTPDIIELMDARDQQ